MTLPTWNLKDFYSSISSNKIQKDIIILEQRINIFSKKYKGKLNSLKKKKLLETLVEFEGIEELSQKIKSFAYLTYCTDQLSEKKKKILSIY